ncbi:[LysW]-L-2-aminoadipate/[LysW]-L-glutamate phosphate reductase [uncultured archaeon]|nr:[LysW]-L-2-aminoadipate/[LysW]-L-glutamate phosphate reductase [uncultured archaeon]
MAKKVSIIGASGYTGGELLRWALMHPEMEVSQITSERFAGQAASKLNPNLRGFTQLQFTSVKGLKTDVDAVFICTPHKAASPYVVQFMETGAKIIDLSADFRLKDKDTYAKYYAVHPHPELLGKAVYGIPELHRAEIKNAKLVACAGCLATSVILAAAPLVKSGIIATDGIIADSKIGSSAGGAGFDISTHHPERSGTVRSYKPSGHRHTAEIEQELSAIAGSKVSVGLTPHGIEMVRGILSTVHARLAIKAADIDLWKAYRSFYSGSPFVRLVKDQNTLYRYPEPKPLVGTNFADIGWEIDQEKGRIIVMAAIDNLVKGSGGQAIQCFNLMNGFDEKLGLWQPGFHPL